MKAVAVRVCVFFFALGAWLGLQAQAPGPARRTTVRADRILVIKSERSLYAMRGDEALRSYRVAFGRGRGAKTAEKDKKTPEGIYEGCRLNLASKYHKAILIPYPTAGERRKGYTGGEIEIHGLPHLPLGLQGLLGGLLVRFGSTRGCVMMTDTDIDDLAAITAFPVTVEIRAWR
jgi:murein L,D-transpeptidase YafK